MPRYNRVADNSASQQSIETVSQNSVAQCEKKSKAVKRRQKLASEMKSAFNESIQESELDAFLQEHHHKEDGGDQELDDIDDFVEKVVDETTPAKGQQANCRCEATILIVDDNPFNLIALEVLLQTHKFKCDKANGGQEAIDMFKANRTKTCCSSKYQIVLMDLNMPTVDGFQATSKILQFQRAMIDKKMKMIGMTGAKNEAMPAVVAAVTAYVNDQTLSQCFQAGMVDVMSKPVDSKTLQQFLKTYHR